ncbi:MAG: segregation/condensation protein A [Methanoregula sp.]|jgi:segregation and condensation protein A|nr:segregation/condensation protein A [Methanoregula sp.]
MLSDKPAGPGGEAPPPLPTEAPGERPGQPDRTDGTGAAPGGIPEAIRAGPGVEDPVEILVGLAEKGEIDPWNIDIIDVTDRFLNELDRRRELNLHISGRTLFFAATLIRMKSEQLVIIEPPEDDDDGEGDDLFGDDFGAGISEDIDYGGRLGPIERLEHEIQRRLDRKNMRKSPVTLFELIIELKNLEKEERRRRRMTDGSGDLSDALLIDADDVVSIAHDEGFQESSMLRLAEYLEGLEIDEEMTLADLCKQMEWGIPEVFIPLLFLALDGRCTLRQEEFYGDIWVQICRTEETESATGTAAE